MQINLIYKLKIKRQHISSLKKKPDSSSQFLAPMFGNKKISICL